MALSVRNPTVQGSFTIRVDATFTTRSEAAFTKALDMVARMRASACLWRTRHAG